MNNNSIYFNEPIITLEQVRARIILLGFYIAIIICSTLAIIYTIEEQYDRIVALVVPVITIIFIIYFARKGYAQIGLIIGSFIILVVHLFAYNIMTQMEIAIHFSLMPAVFSFLMKNKTVRIVYLLMNSITFLIANIWASLYDGVTIFTITSIIIILHVVLMIFINLMEKQEAALFSMLKKNKSTLDALQSKHEDLLLFTNMMNHDIKAPIKTLKGFVRLLKKEKQGDRANKYIGHITKSLNDMDNMVLDLLALTKIDTTELEFSTIDLNDIIDQVCDTFEYHIQTNNVSIIKDELPKVQGNKEVLRTIFQNLISNAIKYQPKDKPEHIPKLNIRYEDGGESHIIYIKDNGIGIKENYIPDLFIPFKRFDTSGEYEGTGLGIFICKKNMEKHKGNITYVPSKDVGTCFRLEFPKNI